VSVWNILSFFTERICFIVCLFSHYDASCIHFMQGIVINLFVSSRLVLLGWIGLGWVGLVRNCLLRSSLSINGCWLCSLIHHHCFFWVKQYIQYLIVFSLEIWSVTLFQFIFKRKLFYSRSQPTSQTNCRSNPTNRDSYLTNCFFCCLVATRICTPATDVSFFPISYRDKTSIDCLTSTACVVRRVLDCKVRILYVERISLGW